MSLNIKVSQFVNKNQFTIRVGNKLYFQSYESLIAEIDPKRKRKVKLFSNWDYSNTTRKHLYIFLGWYGGYTISTRLDNAKNKRQEVLKMIKEGLIIYDKSR